MKGLNHRHQVFCYKYIETQNATEAYLLAGYKVTREVARRNGARLLTNADVLAFINKIQKDLIHESQITVDHIVRQLSKIAFSNGIGDVAYVKNGEIHIRNDANFENVKSVGQRTYESIKRRSRSFHLQTEDRLQALDLLAKLLGFYDRADQKKPNHDLKEAANRMLQALDRLRKRDNK